FDLYQEEFNPVVFEKDEPDWTNTSINYSPVVHREIERMNRNEGLAFIFPVWWYSIPAMLKGYIDRVWNYNYAYGGHKLPHKRAMGTGLARGTKDHLETRKHDTPNEHHLNIGLPDYTGIPSSAVVLLYDTLPEAAFDPNRRTQCVD